MLQRHQKAVVTRAINRYIRNGTLVQKVRVKSGGNDYFVTITPNSKMLLLYVKNYSGTYTDRVSVPRFSDYVVRIGTFTPFMNSFREKTGTKNENKSVGP